MQNDITVHIVDDEEEVRKSLTFLLVCAGFAVRAHTSATAFLDQPLSEGKCCLLIELPMQGVDGVELLECLKARHNGIPAIIISGKGNIALAVQVMKAGAVDFIEKPFKEDVLIAAIKEATAHSDISEEQRDDVVLARIHQLTQREQQVLTGIVDGLQNKQIAFELGISARTVEVHRANVMAKMKARNLPQLMKMVIPLMPAGNSWLRSAS
ncbi:response regulator nodulation protein fixJ [Rhizobium sp. CIAT894]|uniref:response regulator transcription factor n=1 Tax=Rhizobium sp. CIAT894 TaxID=2020312 RepID=UPI000A1FA052|nr:LuxR C-terminal-related transcriptional regulator [Rhizobium sp. CIAT894]ARM90145.1 response regulator nodulation protein fixJ [Rhizobium sp. CIAT894]